MSKKRITDVNYTESLSDNDSVFVNHGDILKQINKKDLFDNIQTKIDEVNENLQNTKVSVDRKINGKELKEDIVLSASDIGLANVLLIESFDDSTGVLNTRSYDYNS